MQNVESLSSQANLEDGLRSGEIFAVHLLVVEMESREVVGYETLAHREWPHGLEIDKGGSLLILEGTGLFGDVDVLMLDETVAVVVGLLRVSAGRISMITPNLSNALAGCRRARSVARRVRRFGLASYAPTSELTKAAETEDRIKADAWRLLRLQLRRGPRRFRHRLFKLGSFTVDLLQIGTTFVRCSVSMIGRPQ